MDAAAMLTDSPSPLTTASSGTAVPSPNRPSMRMKSGLLESASTAFAIAFKDALWMFISSISSFHTVPTPMARALLHMSMRMDERAFGLKAFESFMPRFNGGGKGRITAAATTGPASGPLPASSTPAIRP